MRNGTICLALLCFTSGLGSFFSQSSWHISIQQLPEGYDGYALQKRERSLGWWIKQFHKPSSSPQAAVQPHHPALRGIFLHTHARTHTYTYIHICIPHPPLQTFTLSQENIQHVTDFKPLWASKRNWKDLVFCQFITSSGYPGFEVFFSIYNQQTASASLNNSLQKTCIFAEDVFLCLQSYR